MVRVIRLLVVGFSIIAGLWLAPLSSVAADAGQVRRVLLPLEGFLLQRVPQRYKHDFDDYLEQRIGGELVTFVPRRDAAEFVAKMRAENIELHFVSTLSKSDTRELIRNIRDTFYFFEQALGDRILSRESFKSGRLSLAALPGGRRATDLIATVPSVAVAKADRDQMFDSGRLFYLFPSYEEAKDNRRTARKNAAKFPKNKNEWEVDFNRLSVLYFYVNRRNAGVLSGASLDQAARKIGITQAKLAEFGRDLLHGNVKPDEYAWIAVNGNLTCQRVEVLLNRKIAEPMATCLAKLPVTYEFEADRDGRSVSKCVAMTGDEARKVIPMDIDKNTCLQNHSPEYAWESRDRSKCASYVNSPKGRGSLRLREEDAGRCTDKFARVLKKDGRLVVFRAFNGWEALSEEDLDRRVAAPKPNEENTERLWDADDDTDDRGVNLATCMDGNEDRDGGYDSKRYGHMKEDANNQLLQHCRPDTLYSWGDEQKFTILRGLMSGDTWRPIRPIYSTPGAVTTFNYGPIPLRIKLRPGVKFKATSSHYSCNDGGEPSDEQRETIYYRKDIYKDWVICSPDVIESWSHSMPQHYDEIVKDLRDHRLRPGPENVIYYYYLQNDKRTIFTDDYLDGRSGFTEKVLKEFLQQFVQRVRENKGEVFYNPKTPADRRTVEQHFKTERPLYFNPR